MIQTSLMHYVIFRTLLLKQLGVYRSYRKETNFGFIRRFTEAETETEYQFHNFVFCYTERKLTLNSVLIETKTKFMF